MKKGEVESGKRAAGHVGALHTRRIYEVSSADKYYVIT